MAADIYEYTDAQGRTQRVDDLSTVPQDRLQHMLVIGGEDAPAGPGAGAAAAIPSPAAPSGSVGGIGLEVWAVSGVLMAVAVFNKRFLLRLFCFSTSIIWLLYNGYDLFSKSDLAKSSERKPKKVFVAPPPEE